MIIMWKYIGYGALIGLGMEIEYYTNWIKKLNTYIKKKVNEDV